MNNFCTKEMNQADSEGQWPRGEGRCRWHDGEREGLGVSWVVGGQSCFFGTPSRLRGNGHSVAQSECSKGGRPILVTDVMVSEYLTFRTGEGSDLQKCACRCTRKGA